MKITQHFISGENGYISLCATPLLSSVQMYIDNVLQLQEIDYTVQDNLIFYFGSYNLNNIVVEYDISNQSSFKILSIPDRPEPPEIIEDVSVVVIESNPIIKRFETLVQLYKDLKVPITPASPLIFNLLTSGLTDISQLRPKLPLEVCEYLDLNLPVYQQQTQPEVPSVSYITESQLQIDPNRQALYPPDLCLESYSEITNERKFRIYAQPGDLNYAACNVSDVIEDLYNSSWVSTDASAGGGGAGGGGDPSVNAASISSLPGFNKLPSVVQGNIIGAYTGTSLRAAQASIDYHLRRLGIS